MIPSIKRRTVYWACLGVSLILAVDTAILYVLWRGQLQDQYDATLMAKARALMLLTEFDGRRLDFDLEDELSIDFQHPDDPFIYVMWSEKGRMAGHSPGLAPTALQPIDDGWEASSVYTDVRLPDGRDGRMVQVNFLPRYEYDPEDERDGKLPGPMSDPVLPRLKLIVAWQKEGLEARLVELQLVLAGSFLVVLVLVAASLWVAVTQGFKPVDQLAAWMGRIDADDLEQRIELHPEWVELRAIVQQFHQLLDRLNGAFQREKEVTSSIAHERRTPVTEMRNLAQVAQRWGDDPKLVSEFLPLMVDTSRRMERTIEMFLRLARAEAGSVTLHPRTIGLHEMVQDTFQALNGDSGKVGKTLSNDLPLSLAVRCDPDLLAGIIGNLLDNATSYSPTGAQLRCNGGSDGEKVWLVIVNPVVDLTQEDLPQLFERLWRKSGAGGEGCHRGLGLTLVKAYAGILGLEIKAELSDQGQLSIRVSGLSATG